MVFKVEPITINYPQGPPHYGKSEQRFELVADIQNRFSDPDEAERFADALNKAVEEFPLDENVAGWRS